MTGETKSDRDALDLLADALVDDILAASDEEITAEANADHPDLGMRSIAALERATRTVGRLELEKARSELSEHRHQRQIVTSIDPARARRTLAKIIKKDPSAGITLAARKGGDELSDSDVQALLEDFAELGIGENVDFEDDEI